MAKGCELSYVTDRANCSTEMTEKKKKKELGRQSLILEVRKGRVRVRVRAKQEVKGWRRWEKEMMEKRGA